MDLIINLLWIGFIICVALLVFRIALGLLLMLVVGIGAGIYWVFKQR